MHISYLTHNVAHSKYLESGNHLIILLWEEGGW